MILIVEDDLMMAECLARYCRPREARIVSDVVAAMEVISANDSLPEAIVLDMLLTGPNALNLLHELKSYADTDKIPIAIVSSLVLPERVLQEEYGVSAIFNKANLLPSDFRIWLEAAL